MTAKCVKRQKSLGVLVLTILLIFMMGGKIETSTDFCSSAAITSQRKAKKGVQIYNRNERKRTILYTATQFPAGV